ARTAAAKPPGMGLWRPMKTTRLSWVNQLSLIGHQLFKKRNWRSAGTFSRGRHLWVDIKK
ncbi:MAG: hypothetical protein ABR512_07960, partial [Desulfopila sp.]